MAVSFNVNKAFTLYQQSGGTTNFPDSLKKVLKYMQNDGNLNNEKEAAYLLATAKVKVIIPCKDTRQIICVAQKEFLMKDSLVKPR